MFQLLDDAQNQTMTVHFNLSCPKHLWRVLFPMSNAEYACNLIKKINRKQIDYTLAL